MIATTQDIYYLSLAFGWILLVIFLVVTLIYVILILRDVNQITDKAKVTVDKVNDYVLKPIQLVNRLTDNIKPIIDMIEKKIQEKSKKRKKN